MVDQLKTDKIVSRDKAQEARHVLVGELFMNQPERISGNSVPVLEMTHTFSGIIQEYLSFVLRTGESTTYARTASGAGWGWSQKRKLHLKMPISLIKKAYKGGRGLKIEKYCVRTSWTTAKPYILNRGTVHLASYIIRDEFVNLQLPLVKYGQLNSNSSSRAKFNNSFG